MPPASPGIDRLTWRTLIGPALRVIDSLQSNGYGTLDFRLGGGTVLMFRFDHRVSKDIDVFTHDAQALAYLTPRLNAVSEREAPAYEEHANVVKLLLPQGDIDFIVAGPVIPHAAPETFDLDGRAIAFDATAEILAKKLLYRADSFKARDVFDMAAALSLDPGAAMAAIRATRRTRPALMARLATMAASTPDALAANLFPTDSGRKYADNMVERVRQAISDQDRAC